VLLHHVAGKERQEERSPSWFNLEEVALVLARVRSLLNTKRFGLRPADIGVVTPYSRQAYHIRQMLRDPSQHVHYPPGVGAQLKELKVGSTEEFQGQERRVIIVSTVRSQLSSLRDFDTKYSLGFVNQPKRLNVALTRAKQALIVIGNACVLETDSNWRAFIQHCLDHRAVVGEPRLKQVQRRQGGAAAGAYLQSASASSASASASAASGAAEDDDGDLEELANVLATDADEAAQAAANDDEDSDEEYDDADAPLGRNTEAPWKNEAV
jgi:helicase MOV-10